LFAYIAVLPCLKVTFARKLRDDSFSAYWIDRHKFSGHTAIVTDEQWLLEGPSPKVGLPGPCDEEPWPVVPGHPCWICWVGTWP